MFGGHFGDLDIIQNWAINGAAHEPCEMEIFKYIAQLIAYLYISIKAAHLESVFGLNSQKVFVCNHRWGFVMAGAAMA